MLYDLYAVLATLSDPEIEDRPHLIAIFKNEKEALNLFRKYKDAKTQQVYVQGMNIGEVTDSIDDFDMNYLYSYYFDYHDYE